LLTKTTKQKTCISSTSLNKLIFLRTSEDKVRRKDLCGSVRTVYILKKLPNVSGPDLVEAGRYRMVLELTLVVLWARVSQLRKHGVHGWSGPRMVTQHDTCAGTGHTDVAKRGRSWLGIDRREHQSLKGVRM
jgi:hypothetical protein